MSDGVEQHLAQELAQAMDHIPGWSWVNMVTPTPNAPGIQRPNPDPDKIATASCNDGWIHCYGPDHYVANSYGGEQVETDSLIEATNHIAEIEEVQDAEFKTAADADWSMPHQRNPNDAPPIL